MLRFLLHIPDERVAFGGRAHDGGVHPVSYTHLFRDYIRNNREVSKRLKEAIYRVCHTKYSIGPYEQPKAASSDTAAVSLDETLHNMQEMGVDLKIIDK